MSIVNEQNRVGEPLARSGVEHVHSCGHACSEYDPGLPGNFLDHFIEAHEPETDDLSASIGLLLARAGSGRRNVRFCQQICSIVPEQVFFIKHSHRGIGITTGSDGCDRQLALSPGNMMRITVMQARLSADLSC